MLPTPEQLAEILFQTSLSSQQKEEVLDSLQFLPDEKIEELYARLVNLKKIEEEVVNDEKRIDLKYQMKIEEEMKK